MKPLMFDLFCGLGGATEGFLAEGWHCIGVDNEIHQYGDHRYPSQLWVQDIMTISGAQLRDADFMWASPPCQEFSYMAMPWSLGKAKAAAIRADTTGAEMARLTALFDACFRIQREACEAAGRHIPMVVENVRGAQPWVGRARWSFGSFFLWGDVPALMPVSKQVKVGMGSWYHPSDPRHVPGLGFNTHADKNLREGYKIPGFRFDGSGASFQSASVDGMKQSGDWFAEARKGGKGGTSASFGSKSLARKMASAMIAKIPEPLSRHIARTFYPK